MQDTRTKLHWQNLLHQKCPRCDSKLEAHKDYFVCPEPHATEKMRNCFFIKKEQAAAFLLDPEHPAHICLNVHEKATVEQAILSMGFDPDRIKLLPKKPRKPKENVAQTS